LIRIETLGGFSIRADDGQSPTGSATQPRRMAMLALLARAGERGVNRERLIALLWPDADDERAPRTLAQALYALRKDLGAEDAIVGNRELSFDPALVASDVGEFSAAIARGDDARAVALYHGPFLDGFHVPGAAEFARWVEEERRAIAQQHARALESLARAARTRGELAESVSWWRKLAALEPINARVTVGLMDALAASGDGAAALKHVEIYQLLVQQELDLPADREVLALAERIRRGEVEGAIAVAQARPIVGSVYEPPAPAPIATPTDAPSIPTPPRVAEISSPPAARGRPAPVVVALVAVLIVALVYGLVRGGGSNVSNAVPVVAVGRIASFGADSAQAGLAAPVRDLLATSLARSRGIRVVSQGRMLELMRAAGAGADTSAGAIVDAARRAGATEIIDGTLYTRPGGRLRLDLRRTELANGAIGDVRTTEGNDLFALVDSGTALIVGALGAERPAGSIADVTTKSIAALRMYERGIQAFYMGDVTRARGFFDAALAEDSLFAMAAYYDALASGGGDPDNGLARLNRARELAARTSDRERLIIVGGWAHHMSSPSLRAIADTLVARYPTEVEGHLYAGFVRVDGGDFLGSLSFFERVIAMDSSSLRSARVTCAACEAFGSLVSAYALADSARAAERVARRWLALQPTSLVAAIQLASALDAQDRTSEVDSLLRAWTSRDANGEMALSFRPLHLIRVGNYAAAESLLHAQALIPNAVRQTDAYWTLALSLRTQGRLNGAYDAARQMRRFATDGSDRSPPTTTLLEAQIQRERGNTAAAAALFDSLTRARYSAQDASLAGHRGAWLLAQVADTRAAGNDTAKLQAFADTIRALGATSAYARDQRLYHHVLGRLYAARGDDARAVTEFQQAIYSVTLGYTRTNYELARIHLRNRRPRDAVALLQSALRGSLDASNLYVSRTELHELLAQAWDAASAKDSAAAHYEQVARSWSDADASLAARAEAARSRIAALRR
jgi:DNA-binding SARP family transcriptional activator